MYISVKLLLSISCSYTCTVANNFEVYTIEKPTRQFCHWDRQHQFDCFRHTCTYVMTTEVFGCTELYHYLFSAIIDEDVLRYEIVKKKGKKGYVSMITNYGLLNLELHCEMVGI